MKTEQELRGREGIEELKTQIRSLIKQMFVLNRENRELRKIIEDLREHWNQKGE